MERQIPSQRNNSENRQIEQVERPLKDNILTTVLKVITLPKLTEEQIL